MKKIILNKKLITLEVLSRAQLKQLVGGYGDYGDSGYRCAQKECNLYISSTGATESGYCGWDLTGNPICHCHTSRHPNAVPITRESVCIIHF